MAGYLFPLIAVLSAGMFAVIYGDLPDSTGLVKMKVVELKVNGLKGFGEVFYSNNEKIKTISAFRVMMQKQGFIENSRAKETLSFSKEKMLKTVLFLEERKGTLVISYTSEGQKERTEAKVEPESGIFGDLWPAGSNREYLIERLSGKEKSLTGVYTLLGSAASCESFYTATLKNKGWKQALREKTAAGVILAFENNNRWCNIFLEEKTAVVTLYFY